MIFICISLISKKVEDFSMFMGICVSSSVRCLWCFFAHFPIGFFLLSIRIIKIKNILYILDTNLLFVLWTIALSSKPLQSFYLLHGVFDDQNFVMKYNKMCIFFMSGTFWVLLKKSLPPQSQTDLFICFLLKEWEFHYS